MAKQQFQFKLGKPEAGILSFDVCVEAESANEAVVKLFDYMVEFKRLHAVPPNPIGKSAKPGEVGDYALRKLRFTTEPTDFILTMHLFCEYWLNRLLEQASPQCDLSGYVFSKKLEIVFGVGKLPQHLFANLQKLNTLRNKMAHKIDYDLTQMDLSYEGCDEGWEIKGFKPSFSADAGQHHIFNVLNHVLSVTLVPLQNHCVDVLRLGGGKFWKKDVEPKPKPNPK